MRHHSIVCFIALIASGCGDVATKTPADLSAATDMATVDSGPVPPSCASLAACQNGGGNGLCDGRTCNPCVDTTDDAKCAAIYGSGYLCIGAACVSGGCRAPADCAGRPCVSNQCAAGCTSDSDCTDPATVCNTTSGACVTNASCSGAVNGAACPVNATDLCCGTAGVCASVACCGTDACKTSASAATNDGTCKSGSCVSNSCAAPSGTTRYVDYHGMSGGSGSKSCPYNGVNAALADLESTGGTIIVKSGGAAIALSNSYNVGAGITIVGSDSNFDACDKASTDANCTDSSKWPAITTGDRHAFNFTTAGNRTLRYFSLTGVGAATATTSGIYVTAASVTLDHVSASGYQYGADVGSGGGLTIHGGVNFRMNFDGLNIENSAPAASGGADVELAAGDDPVRFSNNVNHGVVCRGNGTLKMVGPPPTGPSTGLLINANDNGGSGIYYSGTVSGVIDGVSIQSNGSDKNQDSLDGLHVFAYSKLKVRNSHISNNGANGLQLATNGAQTQSQLSQIDFGTNYKSDPGKNTFIGNTISGICAYNVQSSGAGTLRAEGNTFGSADCSSTTSKSIAISEFFCDPDTDVGARAPVGYDNCVKK